MNRIQSAACLIAVIAAGCGGKAAPERTNVSPGAVDVATWTYPWAAGEEDAMERPSLAVDDAYVYVGTAHGIWRARKDGGSLEVVTTAAHVSRGPWQPNLHVKGDSLYWLDDQALLRVAREGGAPEIVTDGLAVPRAVIVGGDGRFYAAVHGEIVAIDASGGVTTFTAGLDCDALEPMSSGVLCLQHRDEIANGVMTGARTLDATVVGQDGEPQGGVSETNLFGTTPSAVLDDVYYFVDAKSSNRNVPAQLLGLHVAESTLADGHPFVRDLTYDDAVSQSMCASDRSFVVVTAAQEVRRIPRDGSAITTIARGLVSYDVVRDDAWFYWVERTNACLRGPDLFPDGCTSATATARLRRAPL